MIVITEFIDERALSVFQDQNRDFMYNPNLWQHSDSLYAHLQMAQAIIVRNKTQVNADLLSHAPNLKVVGRLGVGLDNIDMELCQQKNIAVCPASGANADSVAEYVMASTFILLRGAYMSQAAMVNGQWPRNQLIGYEVQQKKMGLMGFGCIARRVAMRAQAMGMYVMAYDPFIPADSDIWNGVDNVDVSTCLTQADVISLHCPYTPETKHFINENTLATMKPSAVLINTSRGEVVDTQALAQVLRSGQLAGAALDVFEQEPLSATQAQCLKDIENIILTPHIAGVTVESNVRVSAITVKNVLNHL